jgi:hypothetical protein
MSDTRARDRQADESRGRFLRAIAGELPPARVAELHLFPALRQGGVESGVAVIAALPELADPASPGPRHTILTARYRLALKGAERGKWDFSIVEEADAPLVTVDAVVRGVQKRAGETVEPERLSADHLIALAADVA